MEDRVIPVKVAVRVRPLGGKEARAGCQSVIEVVEGEPQIFIPTMDKSWTYDFAMPGSSCNQDLYNDSVKDIVKKLYKGYNVTVLAYGQTGSGKTHSMGTAYRSDGDPELEGVIPRAVGDIFKHIDADVDSVDYAVKVSFVELYNEQLFDLLSSKQRREDTVVDIREDGKGGIKIHGLTEAPASSLGETMGLLEKASQGRVTAATAMNEVSSRSHAIFTVLLEIRPKGSKATDSQGGLTVAKFHLVDLAGSERQKKTKAKGDRMKEGININMGLLALGNVISALGDENRGGNSHIPYRDSKLTRLLQDSLGGNSHTLMIACVSPADSNLEETVSTLRYADRARKIKNKPIVNKDPRSAELGRLRAQVQELRLQLSGGGAAGSSPGAGVATEDKKTMAENVRLVEENEKLASALVASMGENAHMSEKLMLAEQANEKLNLKLTELATQAEEAELTLNQPREEGGVGGRQLLSQLRSKVEEVRDYQKKAEKSIMEHDISRNQTGSLECEEDQTEEALMDGGEEESGASQVLRQTVLASQLADLNKALAAKQELAGKAGENDEKLKKYEETVRSMEAEIVKLQKEKDELSQAQRAGGEVTGKVSEMRRKKIQDLELQISGLKKQQQEHQRLAKLNSQNAAKAARFQEEIRQMKVAKVKLIKTIKEESEKVRLYKARKEKEVLQLKQADRKQKVEITKMSQRHEKRENVLKRKMEETSAINKRLKDAMAKKASAQSMKAANGGLLGAGDRVRGWVKSEVDIVVTVKEAEVTKNLLLQERKTFNQELNKLRQDLRMTLSSSERVAVSARQTEIQQGLDMRNAQIAELQRQILSAEQDKEREKAADRWNRLSSMVEAKLAVQYLFDAATENMATVAGRNLEVRDMATQLDEVREAKRGLQEEMNKIKLKHEDQVVRLERDHEEKILFLLRQLPGQEGPETRDVTLGEDISEVEKRLAFQAKELEKMSNIHDQLMQRDQQLEQLKGQFERNQDSLLPKVYDGSPKKPVKKTSKGRRSTINPVERYNEDEFFEENFSSDSDSSDSEESDSDPEWRKTPMFDRIKKARRSLGGPAPNFKRKRPVAAGGQLSGCEEEEEEEEDETVEDKQPAKRKSVQRCTCKSGCKTKMCSCRKAGPYCTSLCGCPANKCAHREVPGQDVSSAVDTDKENDSVADEMDNQDDTNKLLDNTFDLKPNFPSKDNFTPTRVPLMATNGPIFKTPSSADMFAADSDVEATPTNRRETLFTTPRGVPLDI